MVRKIFKHALSSLKGRFLLWKSNRKAKRYIIDKAVYAMCSIPDDAVGTFVVGFYTSTGSQILWIYDTKQEYETVVNITKRYIDTAFRGVKLSMPYDIAVTAFIPNKTNISEITNKMVFDNKLSLERRK